MPVTQGMRIQMYGLGAGTNFINTIYVTDTVPQGSWSALATKADNDWIRKLNIYQSNAVNWHTVVISQLGGAAPSSQSFSINRPGAGTGLFPMQLALVIKVQTGFSGRSYNGRWFLSGLSVPATNNGLVPSSLASGFPAQATAILNAWSQANPLGGPLCLYSRKLDLLIPVAGLSLSNAYGTVRSRKFGRGI